MDLYRTFPSHSAFCAPQTIKPYALRRVLLAVSHANPNTGYCQGMNYVGGMLLLVVKDEASVFYLLNYIVQNTGYFTHDMYAMKRDQYVINQLVKKLFPKLHVAFESLKDHGISIDMVTQKWLLLLFVDSQPTETVLRVWDAYFYEGDKILFRSILALLYIHHDKILSIASPLDLYTYLRSLKYFDCHNLMDKAFSSKINIKRSEIEALRRDFIHD